MKDILFYNCIYRKLGGVRKKYNCGTNIVPLNKKNLID